MSLTRHSAKTLNGEVGSVQMIFVPNLGASTEAGANPCRGQSLLISATAHVYYYPVRVVSPNNY